MHPLLGKMCHCSHFSTQPMTQYYRILHTITVVEVSVPRKAMCPVAVLPLWRHTHMEAITASCDPKVGGVA